MANTIAIDGEHPMIAAAEQFFDAIAAGKLGSYPWPKGVDAVVCKDMDAALTKAVSDIASGDEDGGKRLVVEMISVAMRLGYHLGTLAAAPPENA